jgi:hypothetical protein
MPRRVLDLAALLLTTLLVAGPALATSPDEAGAPAAPDRAGDSVQPYYFYHARPYGSERLVGPLRMITNGGFGILQLENRSNQLDEIDWGNGWENLWRNLLNPVSAIEEKGWWDFIRSEVIPVSFGSGDAQYWPNYMNHLIGGGMGYRNMREWFRYHGFAHERTWALTTLTVYHFLNEVVEMDDKTGWRVDPIADMYIFNVAGVLVFENDRIARFFGETLAMRDWSFQPFYDPRAGSLENVGQNYSVRLRLGRTTPWHMFYHWGNSGELGVSRDLGDGGDALSVGAGFVAKNLEDVDGISETVNLATSFGIFWERDRSLMASLLYAREKDYRYRLNVYPGVFEIAGLQPGLTFISARNNDFLAGITIGNWPLLPVGVGSRVGNDR